MPCDSGVLVLLNLARAKGPRRGGSEEPLGILSALLVILHFAAAAAGCAVVRTHTSDSRRAPESGRAATATAAALSARVSCPVHRCRGSSAGASPNTTDSRFSLAAFIFLCGGPIGSGILADAALLLLPLASCLCLPLAADVAEGLLLRLPV